MYRRSIAVAAAAAWLVGTGAATGFATAAAQETGTVYVVHGIPATPVDVYVDGSRALDDFAPATTAGPLDLPAGPHEVKLFPADAADGSGTPVLQASAEVPGGGNVALVAHLNEAGQPAITPFVNDVSALPAGKARVVVRHTAAAPAVDVRAGGTPVITGLTNPNQEALVVDAGTVSADVVLAGTTTVALGPADLNLAEGTATFVHAIGSAQQNTLALVPFVVSGLHSAPGGVPAGNGEPAGQQPGLLPLLVGAAVLGSAMIAGGAGAAFRRRTAPAGNRR